MSDHILTNDLQMLEWAFNHIGVKTTTEVYLDQIHVGADDGQSWQFIFDKDGKYIRSMSA